MSEAVAALMSGLDARQSARLADAIQQITVAAIQRYGVAPTLDEVVGTGMCKEATYGGDLDMENALFQIGQGETVKNAARFAESGIVTAADIEAIPPHLRSRVKEGQTAADLAELDPQSRMAISRALTLSKNVRNPGLPDVRDPQVKAYEDSKPLDQMTPADRIAFARRNGGA